TWLSETLVGPAGTLTHMAPEQFLDASSCDERSDVYSFGVVLFQMVCQGGLPFIARPPEVATEEECQRFSLSMNWRHAEFPVPRLDSPLFPIICRCLEKKPQDRYSTFRELRLSLEMLEPLNPAAWCNKGACLH